MESNPFLGEKGEGDSSVSVILSQTKLPQARMTKLPNLLASIAIIDPCDDLANQDYTRYRHQQGCKTLLPISLSAQ